MKKKNTELEEKLKKYTNSNGHKKYYENNSDFKLGKRPTIFTRTAP